jgi:hypothetical protein
MAVAGMGFFETILVVLFGFGSAGLPLGIPPLAEDPLLAKVAPEECSLYVSWAGMADPDATTKNSTEQLLAEREMQQFFKQVEAAIGAGLLNDARDNEGRKVIAVEGPKLFKALLTRPTAAFLGDIKVAGGGPPSISGGLIVSTGDQTAALMASLARIEQAIGDLNEVEAGGQKWKEFPVPDGAPRLVWGFKGKYFILGIGEGGIEGILKRARGEAPKWLTAVRERIKVPRFSSMIYVNVKKLAAIPGQAGAPPQFAMAVKALGLGNISHLASVTGLDDSGCVTRSHIALDGQAEGLLKLAAGRPLTAADLAPIPADANLAIALRLDPEKVFRAVKEIATTIEPRAGEALDTELDQAQEALGIDFSKDVFQAVGDTWRIYNSPSDGGLIFTGLTAVVDVRNAENLRKALTKIEEAAQKAAGSRAEPDDFGRTPRHVTVKHFEHHKQTVYFLNFVGDESPVSPAWCVTDKELIVSLFPSHVKSYLDRGSNFKPITNVPAVAAMFTADRPPTFLAYHDTREAVKLIYPIAQIGANLLTGELQRSGAKIDMAAFPSLSAILPHIQPTTSTFAPVKDGFEVTTHQTVPVAFGGGALFPMIMYFGVGRAAPRFEDAPPPIIEDFRALPRGGGGDGVGAAAIDKAAALEFSPRRFFGWTLAP